MFLLALQTSFALSIEIAKIIFKQPAQDAKIDELHKTLNDTLAQLRQLVK